MVLHSQNKKVYSEKNYLKNGNKTQGQTAKSSFNTTLEKPALNESGIDAKKKGF